jgi:hypothetical protein
LSKKRDKEEAKKLGPLELDLVSGGEVLLVHRGGLLARVRAEDHQVQVAATDKFIMLTGCISADQPDNDLFGLHLY